jgi:hypothetical protein
MIDFCSYSTYSFFLFYCIILLNLTIGKGSKRRRSSNKTRKGIPQCADYRILPLLLLFTVAILGFKTF